jgi:hypothetical protein
MTEKNDKNIVLGRGKLFFAQRNPVTLELGGERYLGNTSGFTIQAESQDVKHYDSDSKIRVQDANATTQVDYMGNITTDQIDADNMSMFFFGSSSALAQASETAQTYVKSVDQGYSYQIGVSDTDASGVRMVSNVGITDDGAVTTFVAGTDYTVDLDLGRVFIVKGGGIVDATEVTITYDVAASTRTRVISGRNPLTGLLRYISDNATGKQQDYIMPNAVLRPNGEFALKAESDWQSVQFNAEFLAFKTLEAIIAETRPA